MKRALERADKPHIYIEQDDGDHPLSHEGNRIEFLQALGDFLAQHIGGSNPQSAAQ